MVLSSRDPPPTPTNITSMLSCSMTSLEYAPIGLIT